MIKQKFHMRKAQIRNIKNELLDFIEIMQKHQINTHVVKLAQIETKFVC